ncbi:TerD family protein [Nocardia beijingensis]|uniref:TerD family protein n=1 Tax=Nocardia beijingensis TaxID=95162 RepID=UPI0018947890|nr:TerD family protein [Nocardia beijingensis]MBF6074862.1 TerD family protein [Nocardia beijingensis]
MKLSKGANAAVPTSLLAVVVSWRSEHAVDAHALLLDASGSVRSDRDLVFYNAPRHVSQAVTLDQEPAPGTARLSISLPRTEADVDRIVVSGSVEDATFGDIDGLTVAVHSADGAIATFEIDDADAVQALMFGEFYRRDGQWRFRAIGQGWSSGLAGLVTEFGVQVNDPEAPVRTTHPTNPFRVRRPAANSSARERLSPDREAAERPLRHDPARRFAHGSLPSGQPPRNGDSPSEAETTTGAETAPVPRDPLRADDSSGRLEATDLRPGIDTPARPHTEVLDRVDTSPLPRPTHRPVDLHRHNHDAAPPAPPPPQPELADWHPDPGNPQVMRWWDGTAWTEDRYLPPPPGDRHCARCGNALRRKFFGGYAPCQRCAQEIEDYLVHWHNRAWRVLTGHGPRGSEWAELWASLRYQRIDAGAGRAALRDAALTYVERLVTFAFADGEVRHAELELFEHAVTELALGGPLIEDLRRRMHRGNTLYRLRTGDLPIVRTPGLHLDPEETVHLDLPATHVRQLARGPKLTEGRLIGSNKKLRFVGADTGIEMPWSRVVSVHAEQGTVVIAATSARGGATFAVDDPDYVSAALEGALRVAKRLVLTPGQRDTRSIPQEVKAQVWQRDGGRCVECGDGHYLEFDHIIPLSRGGATSAANLQILCRACNRAKGARI